MRKSLLAVLFIISATCISAQSWNWAASPTSTSFARFDAITIDPNGYTYACGIYNDTAWFGSFVLTTPAPGVSYGFVAKYSPAGACIWARGDSLKANAFDIVIDADRNSYVVGNLNAQFILAKWDSSGIKLWDSLLPPNVGAYDLVMDASGTCWMSGKLTAGQATFGSDILTGPCGFIAEFDANGSSLQAYPLGRTGKIDPSNFVRTAGGDVVIAAKLSGADTIGIQPFNCQGTTVLMLKFDNARNLLWWNEGQAPAPGNANATPWGLALDANNNCYMTCGLSLQDFIFGNDTVFMHPSGLTAAILKFDANGNVMWLRQPTYTGTGNVYFMSVVCDQDEVYFTGYTEEDFTVGQVDVTDTSNAYYMFYMMAMDLSGNPLYEIHTTGNISIALPRDLVVDNTGTIWIAGMHSNAPSFGPYSLPDPPSGVDYGFLVQLEKSGVGMHEIVSSHSIELFSGMEPQTFTLQVDETLLQEKPLFVLYDVTGRVVKTISISESRTAIDCVELAAGVYTWSVENAEERFSGGKLLNQ